MNRKFWRRAHLMWHCPHMHAMGPVPEWERFCYWLRGVRTPGEALKMLRWMFRELVRFWQLYTGLGICCQGDLGGWQTRLCDAIERRAGFHESDGDGAHG